MSDFIGLANLDMCKEEQSKILPILLSVLEYSPCKCIENNKVTEQEMILKGVGRVRDLKIGPDGALYVLLNSPDMVLRISPDKGS